MTLTNVRTDLLGSSELVHVSVLADRCAGCQECVVRCPTGALSMDTATWTVISDDATCVGCRQCVRTCPFSAIEVSGPLVTEPRIVIDQRHRADVEGSLEETRAGIATWSGALAEASRCLTCPDPTCVRGCPAHVDIPGFIAGIRAGDIDEAHEVLRRATFMPDVCSRVCDQAVQCEGACTWSLAGGEPVAIGALERFVADNAPVPNLRRLDDRGAGLDVAIVGSGPAAIGAAFELARSGASVKVFEKDGEPGGLLRSGIPDFTLPRSVASRPWESLLKAGVTIECGVEIAPEAVGLLLSNHDAVVLAYGAGLAMRLPVEGGDLEGVCDATRFLSQAQSALATHKPLGLLEEATARREDVPPTVLVLGAGNTAMDVARLARRLGANAICVDWMDRRFAPVRPDELSEAAEEGVEIRFSTTLERLEGESGHVVLASLTRTRQASAKELPAVVNGSAAEKVPVDLVVMAMGYRIDPQFAGLAPGSPIARTATGLADRRWQASGLMAGGTPAFARRRPIGELALGREVGRLSAALKVGERVWAAGDALVGPSTVVEAMAQGRVVAHAILDARPARMASSAPSSNPAREPAKVARILVAYESRSGHTEALAREVSSVLSGGEAAVTLRHLDEIGLAELAAADMVVLGTWVQGLVFARVGPAKQTREWLRRLPPLGGLKFSTFCTYAVDPRQTLALVRGEIESRGGTVVVEEAFSNRAEPGRVPTGFAARVRAAL